MLALPTRVLATALIFAIFYLIIFIGNIKSEIFLHINSFLLVFLGTLGSCMLSFNFKQIFTAFYATAQSLLIDKEDQAKKKEIMALVEVAEEVKKTNGFGCIDEFLDKKKYSPFLHYGLELISSGYEEKKMVEMLNNFSHQLIFKQKKSEDIMQHMGSIAPAFGMIGTVMGLIIMLTNLDSDAGNIGRGLAFALITTLYGVLLSNIIFTPASVYIYEQRLNQKNHLTAILSGLIKLKQRTDPILLQDYLNSYLLPKKQIKIHDK